MRKQRSPLTIGVGPIVNVRSGKSKSTSTKTRTGSPKSSSRALDILRPELHFPSVISVGIPASDSSSLNERRRRMREMWLGSILKSVGSEKRARPESSPYFLSTIGGSTSATPATDPGATKTSTTFASPSVGVSGLLTACRGSLPTDSTDSTNGAIREATDFSTRRCNLHRVYNCQPCAAWGRLCASKGEHYE